MVGSLKYQDSQRIGSTQMKVFIDGELVDTIVTDEHPHEGMELESDAITRALEGRRVINTFFAGRAVNVQTEPDEAK